MLNKELFNKRNLRTIILAMVLFIPFIWGTNLAAIWFSDMGKEKISIIKKIGISFLILGPYWVVTISGFYKRLRRILNYKLFNLMFFIIYFYYFFLIDSIVNNLIK
ncbi:hypothetical protein ACV3OB_00935 [Clostridium perfringens]|uniref:Uncharacterized protein n=3 Tax=Clostridium perfringens TaxID=1502 RepID=A0AAW4ITR4_CLOPF|nr:hypothetical protein [Clostridium perfringens]EHK2365353.1 hypothetical protein [Clostridium perfringens]EHP50303.1 hypothetical protein HMPREF9476_00255 [Clostridium perfringens WAL-14572]EJT6495800.1 hypothetical protein [Clostridium perfringens]EJT6664107.1 hypothetical protein [Clostridium perfringens]ELC8417620.1 hypothetical protein [Clostridium perfringens]